MKRHALFVGVDQYADGHIPNLSCAVSDATDLHGFFKYGAGYDRVELLPDTAGKKDVLGAVRELTAGLGQGDFFLFFFAGHGFRVGENHVLVCAKDLYDDVKYEDDGLPLGQFKRRLSGAFDSALLLDDCQSDILATRGGEGLLRVRSQEPHLRRQAVDGDGDEPRPFQLEGPEGGVRRGGEAARAHARGLHRGHEARPAVHQRQDDGRLQAVVRGSQLCR